MKDMHKLKQENYHLNCCKLDLLLQFLFVGIGSNHQGIVPENELFLKLNLRIDGGR